MVKTGLSEVMEFLKNHADFFAADARGFDPRKGPEVLAFEDDFAVDDFPGRVGGCESQNAQRGYALLPEPDSPTNPRTSPGKMSKLTSSHCAQRDARFGVEVGLEAADLQEWLRFAHRNLEYSLGSNASRTASPMKTMSRRVMNIAASGKKTNHHLSRLSTPCSGQF